MLASKELAVRTEIAEQLEIALLLLADFANVDADPLVITLYAQRIAFRATRQELKHEIEWLSKLEREIRERFVARMES